MRASVGEWVGERIASNPTAVKMLKYYYINAENIRKWIIIGEPERPMRWGERPHQWGKKNQANSLLCMVEWKTSLSLPFLLGGLYSLTCTTFNTLHFLLP